MVSKLNGGLIEVSLPVNGMRTKIFIDICSLAFDGDGDRRLTSKCD